MKWFKHGANASREVPVGQILAEMGYYGVGVLWTMMERVVWNDGRVTVRELEREFCARHFSKRLVRKIIMDYGLFAVDSNERVSIAKKQSAKTPDDIPDVIPDDTPDDKAKTLDDIPDDTPSNAPAYLDKEIDIEEEVEVEETETTTPTTDSSSDVDDKDGVLTKYRGQPWYPYVSSLLAETDGQIWRETVAIQSGYGELLLRHWPVAVQEFAKHITSYDTGRDIYSVQRARYYFMSFVRGNTKTGAALKEVLQYLDSYE